MYLSVSRFMPGSPSSLGPVESASLAIARAMRPARRRSTESGTGWRAAACYVLIRTYLSEYRCACAAEFLRESRARPSSEPGARQGRALRSRERKEPGILGIAECGPTRILEVSAAMPGKHRDRKYCPAIAALGGRVYPVTFLLSHARSLGEVKANPIHITACRGE